MKGPLRVCFVGLWNLPVLAREYAHLGAGGAQLQQVSLARRLVERGLDVSMVVADLGQADGRTWDRIRTFKAYRPDAGVPLLRFFHPRWTGLWSAMRRADAHVYYVSCAGMEVGEVAAFARAHRRRAVFRVASDSDCDPSALLIRYARDKRLYEFGLRRVDAILAQTTHQQTLLREHYAVDSRVVPSIVNARRLPPPPDGRDIAVLWVGNIRELKRPEMLVKLAQALPDLSFHMAGGPFEGCDGLFARMQAASRELPNFTFHGFVPLHQVDSLFARARLLVNTSEIEGFPNTFLQAWTQGTPVVSFLDPQERIRRHGLGRAVQSFDGMQRAIDELCRPGPAWDAASGAAERFMREEFDAERIVDLYLEAISAVAPGAVAA